MVPPLCLTSNFLNDPLPAAKAVARNLDLVTLILVRLPMKSLLRFKCVSKQWLCRISSQNFYSHHRSLSQIPGRISHLYLNCSSSEQPLFVS
ncbi:hypothetical protein TB2_022168 [Malus domestica]